MERPQMPQEITLDVEAFFAVGTEEGSFAGVRPLVDDHGCVTGEYFLANVA